MEMIKWSFNESETIEYFFTDYYENISELLHKELYNNIHKVYYGNIANIEEIKQFLWKNYMDK